MRSARRAGAAHASTPTAVMMTDVITVGTAFSRPDKWGFRWRPASAGLAASRAVHPALRSAVVHRRFYLVSPLSIQNSLLEPPALKARRRPSGCTRTSSRPGSASGSGEGLEPSAGTLHN